MVSAPTTLSVGYSFISQRVLIMIDLGKSINRCEVILSFPGGVRSFFRKGAYLVLKAGPHTYGAWRTGTPGTKFR
jgi:hypothetical protein